jgi:hypothetical protein
LVLICLLLLQRAIYSRHSVRYAAAYELFLGGMDVFVGYIAGRKAPDLFPGCLFMHILCGR